MLGLSGTYHVFSAAMPASRIAADQGSAVAPRLTQDKMIRHMRAQNDQAARDIRRNTRFHSRAKVRRFLIIFAAAGAAAQRQKGRQEAIKHWPSLCHIRFSAPTGLPRRARRCRKRRDARQGMMRATHCSASDGRIRR